LRNARVYKPAFDHKTVFAIITEGDGRTMPHHFDPQVLMSLRETSSRFEDIYERLKERSSFGVDHVAVSDVQLGHGNAD
jgi:HD-GYP domain-containing protein (c-di-GMP phosphodiesterase class II)